MADSDAREVSRLWKVYRTVHEMLDDRGYLVAPEDRDITLDQFKGMFAGGGVGRPDRAAMTAATSRKGNPEDNIMVTFVDEENVSKKTMKAFVLQLEERKYRSGIMIYRKKMTPAAKKVIVELAGEYHLEEYAEQDLIVNITKHFLVPKHEVMSPEEKKALLERYRLKEQQLPRIQLVDPVARYYGVRRGQVMKITRESETAGRYVTYRIVL